MPRLLGELYTAVRHSLDNVRHGQSKSLKLAPVGGGISDQALGTQFTSVYHS